MDKHELRRLALEKRRMLPAEFRRKSGEYILRQLVRDPVWSAAEQIGCYASLPDEVPTRPIVELAISMGKRIAFPVIQPDHQTLRFHHCPDYTLLESGPLGIAQPGYSCPELSFSAEDLLLVPGVAFDPLGNRLGFGKGYFDRFLSVCPAHVYGLAYDIQIVDQVPISVTDIPMEKIFTEVRVIHCSPTNSNRSSESPA